VILAQADLVEAQRALENLRDSEVAKANAQQALVVAQKAFNDAQRVRDNKDRGRASQETIDSAYAGYILAQDKVDILQGIFNNMSNLEEDNPSRANALANLANAKKERDKALVNLNWYKGEPNEQEIAEADASLAVATANLADAQREWDRLKNGPDPDDIKAAEARIAAIQATLDTAQITAPFSGTITDINAKPGDMVSMATPAFSLDDLTRLLVDVPVTEVDVNRIRTGQEVSLTFDAIPSKNYTGMTTHVSRVGVEEQGVVTFVVTVELTDPDELVRPGMTAAVNIVSTQLEDVLLVPNRAVRLLEGERVVYVLRNGVPEPVQVQLGASSDAYSQVVESSLKEGDLIVLNPPSQFQGGPGFGMGG
jgi:HlyD family secretion protein